MKLTTLFLLFFLLFGKSLFSQVAVNNDGTPPDGSAMLDVKSTSKGLLLPRLTQEQRNAIVNPAAGLQLFNTTTSKPNYFDGTAWKNYDGTTAFSLPTVTTMPVTFTPGIGGSATGGGNVTWDGGTAITARGVCWGAENPTLGAYHSEAEGSTGIFTSIIYDILPFGTYHVRAYATNSAGTAYGNDVSFIAPPYVIGQPLHGGTLFYLFPGGMNGLIAGSNDLVIAPWGCHGFNTANGDSLGAGLVNTLQLLACGGNCAGSQCHFFGYSLPSKTELQLMYNQKNMLGGFNNGIYWSSTQANVNEAFGINFTSGEPISDDKNANHLVRPIWYIYDPW